MMEMTPLFTATDVKNHVYCPAITYMTHVLGLRETETEYMMYGSEVEREGIISSVIPLINAVKVIRGMPLQNGELRGVVDYVLVTRFGDYVPLDVKWSEPSRPKAAHVIQLTAYAMLLESAGYPVKMGILYYVERKGSHMFRILITGELRRRLRNVIMDMKHVISGGINEAKVDERKCPNCNYRAMCPIGSSLSH
jgi:CRISPR-associated protein Cas4